MTKRIDYFDGLKGLCGVLVPLYHFMILENFYGFVGYGTNYSTEGAVNQIMNNPLSAFLTNNSVGFYLFLLLIAVFPVISFRKKNSNPEVMGRYACKRYFQLMPMCFILSILMVILYDAGLTHFEDFYYLTNNSWVLTCRPNHTNILLAIKAMLIDCWLTNVDEITSLWCMYIILKGSLLVYASYALFGQSKHKYLPTLALFIISFADAYMLLFAFGSILGEMLASGNEKRWSLPVSLFVLILSICLLKIPLNLYPINISEVVPCSIFAFTIVLSIVKCEALQHFFSNKVLIFLGKISFEMIACHIFLLVTIAYPLTVFFMTKMELGFLLGLSVGVICTILTIPLAYFVSKWITPFGNKLAKKVENICFGEIEHLVSNNCGIK